MISIYCDSCGRSIKYKISKVTLLISETEREEVFEYCDDCAKQIKRNLIELKSKVKGMRK